MQNTLRKLQLGGILKKNVKLQYPARTIQRLVLTIHYNFPPTPAQALMQLHSLKYLLKKIPM